MKARAAEGFLGPGAASATELERSHFVGLSPARWLALFIATGIGLHNFSEGLAIGQSAATDEISLAYVLVIGFGLHNATEGFGIVAPLSGDAEQPSWRFLALLGVIGGGADLLRHGRRAGVDVDRASRCSSSRSPRARSSTS